MSPVAYPTLTVGQRVRVADQAWTVPNGTGEAGAVLTSGYVDPRFFGQEVTVVARVMNPRFPDNYEVNLEQEGQSPTTNHIHVSYLTPVADREEMAF